MNNPLFSTSPITLYPTWQGADFILRANKIIQQLQQDNIKSAAFWFDDASSFACCLLACFAANVRVLLPPNLLAENRQWIAENADLFLNDENFEYFAAEQKPEKNRPLFEQENQTEVWLKTSGSSGEAKIIVKTAQQLWSEAREITKVLPFREEKNLHIIGSVSVQHMYGLTFRIMLPLFNGWSIGREQLVYPEYLLAESRRCTNSVWISSPALLNRLNLNSVDFSDCNLAAIISSGGALAETTAVKINAAADCPLIEIYGSSETGAIASRIHSPNWQPLPDCTIGCDEKGTLWVESARILQREQTADAVEINDKGFHLLGRIDRIVKLGDKRISLVKIEQDLQQHPLVKDCYVAQHPDLQRIVAWVSLNQAGIETLKDQGRKAVTQQLKRHLEQTQEKFALPRFWRFADELPRNSQSKISRNDFEQICTRPIVDPIWLSENAVENSLVLKGRVPVDLVYFKGHFSRFPLVPGVIELQWITDQIPRLLGKQVQIERIDNLKFQQFVRPNDLFDLTLKWDEAKGRVQFQLKIDDKMCGSGLIIIKAV